MDDLRAIPALSPIGLPPIRLATPEATPARGKFASEDTAGPGRTNLELDARLRRLDQTVRAVVASLNAATIEAVCNEDGTITVTLTLPNLPGN